MQFVDKALARRLESGEEMPQVMYARMFQKTRPEIGAAEEEICGGGNIFFGGGLAPWRGGRGGGGRVGSSILGGGSESRGRVLSRAPGAVAGGFVSHA